MSIDSYDIDPMEGLAYLADEAEDPWIQGVAARAIDLRKAADEGGDYSTDWAILIADVLGVASDSSVPEESRTTLFYMTSRWAWDRRQWIRDNQLRTPSPGGIEVRSQPVLWYELIREAEALRNVTGWGLASVWAHIHNGPYAAARTALDSVRHRLREAERASRAAAAPEEEGPG